MGYRSPTEPESLTINTIMGNFPEGSCDTVWWPEHLAPICTLESKSQGTGRPAGNMANYPQYKTLGKAMGKWAGLLCLVDE